MDNDRENRFEALLEAAPDAMFCVREDARIALVNMQTERLFGYERGELVGELIDVLVPERMRGVGLSHRIRYISEPQSHPMDSGIEFVGLRKDGSEFPAEMSLSATKTEGGVLIISAVRDISSRLRIQAESEYLQVEEEHERMEVRLHQSQRLESLGQLAGGIAHDFNNLLSVMMNYSSFVHEAITNAPDGVAGEYWKPVLEDLDQITLASKRAADLTHQLLAFSHREIIRPQVVDINSVIKGIEQLLRRTLGEDIELKTSLATELWPVRADPGQIEQVLVNLIVNARDAMPSGGTLSIDTQNVITDDEFVARHVGSRPGKFARVRVADTGTGMTEEVRAHVFEPFFTTKPKGEGMGLGLATVNGIITQAGGYAEVNSELGVGTTFAALLPVTDEAIVLAAKADRMDNSSRGETILVVEDEELNRELTRRMLARNGYQLLTATSGQEAIELASKQTKPIDLLVTDVIMPRMLGKAVAEQLRAAHPSLRVLFMSGYAQSFLASRGTLDPDSTLLEKPFTEADLLAKVREVLDN